MGCPLSSIIEAGVRLAIKVLAGHASKFFVIRRDHGEDEEDEAGAPSPNCPCGSR